jgi:hypothetical protein
VSLVYLSRFALVLAAVAAAAAADFCCCCCGGKYHKKNQKKIKSFLLEGKNKKRKKKKERKAISAPGYIRWAENPGITPPLMPPWSISRRLILGVVGALIGPHRQEKRASPDLYGPVSVQMAASWCR